MEIFIGAYGIQGKAEYFQKFLIKVLVIVKYHRIYPQMMVHGDPNLFAIIYSKFD